MGKSEQKESYEKGIDVSHFQGEVDWDQVVADGIKHALIKMSEGGTYTDPKFVTNWQAAKKAGIKVGVYHYFRGLSSTPEEQAENIKKNLKLVDFDLSKNSLAIDVEQRGNESVTPDTMADNLQDLITRIKQDVLPGCNPMIYCSPSYWDSGVNWKKYDFSVHKLWVANWDVKEPRLPKGWNNWTIWQYSSKGNIKGISGDVDLDWVSPPSPSPCCNIL